MLMRTLGDSTGTLQTQFIPLKIWNKFKSLSPSVASIVFSVLLHNIFTVLTFKQLCS